MDIMRLAVVVMLAFIELFAAGKAGAKDASEKFAVYYADQAPISDFEPYQLLVLDHIHHPPLQPLREHGKTLLGYVSLGEVKESDPYFHEVQQQGLVLDRNPNWPGSYYVDIRNPAWAKLVVEEIIPSVLRTGFNGVFFDTLDSPLYLEETQPQKYKGTKESAKHLIEMVRMHYPDMLIMVNRAYSLLPSIGSIIDMELGESVYADYDFSKKTYGKVDAETNGLQLKWLREAKQKNPKLKIYTLDYADPKDTKSIKNIYKVERDNGFIPYVATVGLDQLVEEPE